MQIHYAPGAHAWALGGRGQGEQPPHAVTWAKRAEVLGLAAGGLGSLASTRGVEVLASHLPDPTATGRSAPDDRPRLAWLWHPAPLLPRGRLLLTHPHLTAARPDTFQGCPVLPTALRSSTYPRQGRAGDQGREGGCGICGGFATSA